MSSLLEAMLFLSVSFSVFEMATSLNSALAWFRKCGGGRQKVTQLFQGLEINMENNMGPQDACRS